MLSLAVTFANPRIQKDLRITIRYITRTGWIIANGRSRRVTVGRWARNRVATGSWIRNWITGILKCGRFRHFTNLDVNF